MTLSCPIRVAAAALVCLSATLWNAAAAEDPKRPVKAETPDTAQTPNGQSLSELTAEAKIVEQTLRAALPPDSEARLMLDDIMQGKQLGPTDGWFKVSVSQSRFDWKFISKHYDQDQDGKVSREEFPGPDADFQHLDRNRDHAVTESDLDLKSSLQVRSPGAQLFSQSDLDGNGKLTEEEFLKTFRALDSGGLGFVTLEDMRQRFPAPGTTGNESRLDAPDRSTLLLGLSRQEIGSLQPGPNVGDPAPDFSLPSLDGVPTQLSAEVGKVPVVLIFGNFSCGPFRGNSGDLEKLAQRFQNRAKIFLIYVREAHPKDGWWMMANQRVGIDHVQPTTNEERCEIAGRCRQHLQLSLPFLVDDIGDSVGALYSGMPNRLYLIDREGRIAFKSGRGPFGFRPAELEQALIWLLAESPAEPTPVAGAN